MSSRECAHTAPPRVDREDPLLSQGPTPTHGVRDVWGGDGSSSSGVNRPRLFSFDRTLHQVLMDWALACQYPKDGCEMLEEQDLAEPKQAQHKLNLIMSDSRPAYEQK